MDAFKCSDCHMTFGTVGLLQKHKRKFCVGGSLGDPDNLLLRKGLYSADTPRQRPLSPDDRPLEGSEIVSKKVNQLRAFKDKREKLRDIRNLEERLLLDNLEDTERKLGDSPRSPRRTRSRLPLSRHPEVRDLQIEYERLKDEENRTVGYGGPLPPPVREIENISPMSDTSMSIHLPGESKQFGRLGTQDIGTRALELRIKADYPHYNPNQEAQLRQLAENHGRQMEYLQIKNRDLEKQREDIRRRLEQLGQRVPGKNNSADLLAELRAQEERNQKALNDLRRQLFEMGSKRVNVIEVEKPMNYPQPIIQQSLPPPPPQEKERKSYIYPVYYGSSLVAEISAMRQAYLQNGGNERDVLDQLSQMQAEAQRIEDEMKNTNYDNRHREKKPDLSGKMQMIEMENDRLHKELMLLQEQNFLNQNKRKSDREDELERELQRLREEQLRKMLELQNEIALLKQRALWERRPDPPQAPPPQPKNAEMPWLLQRPYVDVEPMQPYDQYAGFMIFYDFVLNLDPRTTACRLIVGLHGTGQSIGEPTVLPTVYTEPATRAVGPSGGANAVIGARQPVPKCPADSDLGVVVELQLSGGPASEYDKHSLITRAWVKVPLFDNDAKLIAGKFRIPFRNVPIKPFLHASELQKLEKFDDAELYYRIVNMRDSEVQSLLNISASNHQQYNQPTIPSLYKTPTPVQNPPPPPSIGSRMSSRELRLPSITPTGAPLLPRDTTIGFQVDRVKKAEFGEGKVRVTAYYASTGKVVQSSTSPVTCSTTAVKSNFKYGFHVFGQQEATFNNVDMQGDMVLIARFYLRKRQDIVTDDIILHDQQHDATLYDEETLVAWTAVPLVMSTEDLSLRTRRNFNPNTMNINTGTHTLKLFYPPVPDSTQIPFDNRPYKSDWTRYGKASLRIHIFQGQPRPGSLTPSEESAEDGEEVLPEFAWLPLDRKTPPKEPFLIGDGFDLYIDGCRFLPDSVTFSKVAGRVLDRKYGVFGKDINTTVKLDSEIYNPVYENKIEFRESNIPPSATLLLKIYTVDNFYKSLSVVGYATLNIFVESGTERQPTVDQPGLQISLNEGAHQLRLYSQGPNGVDPLSETSLRDANIRIVPCASALVRLTRVPKGSTGKALEQSKVPETDWLRLGLYIPRPRYTDRIYYSSKCLPTKGESRLFHSMMKRPSISMRDAVAKLAKAKESFYRSDKNIEEYIRNKLTKGQDNKAIDQDLTYICQYNPKSGVKIAVDSALNLPWTNFTHAHICLNPPGAFYMGAPHAAYDKLTFTELLDLKSTNTSPTWKDGFKHFPRRSFHRFLCAIIHLQEVQVTIARENYKYGLLEQAWTAVQLFVDKYTYTTTFQLPLFQGAPTPQMLKQLAREPCRDWMERNIRNNTIYLLEGASVFVRVSDGRRDDELAGNVTVSKLVEVNTDYIPAQLEADYTRERPGKVLESFVPPGKAPDQFNDSLAIKFKNLVYKLYEDDKVNK
ncbi:uncharacterized protein LOC127733070 isoform X1 [Mytilus californianus]|uniref:uncharacterized protein LOC127733070 isoform X1 n=1 Tax=Mytilus californianus TaxID=6549 RepID=UPI00224818E5|nr:uncharacterized protein LOC127733070 isoform X1 [Mytilus californianus]